MLNIIKAHSGGVFLPTPPFRTVAERLLNLRYDFFKLIPQALSPVNTFVYIGFLFFLRKDFFNSFRKL